MDCKNTVTKIIIAVLMCATIIVVVGRIETGKMDRLRYEYECTLPDNEEEIKWPALWKQ